MMKWIGRLALVGLGLLIGLVPAEIFIRSAVGFNPPITECDATYGFRLLADRTVPHNLPGDFNVRYRLNNERLRGEDIALEKDEDVVRLLALGDSFTFGIGVEDDETYAAQLGARIAQEGGGKVEVINAGVPAWGTAQQLLYLIEEGLKYQPDLITVGFFVGNDPLDNLEDGMYSLDADGRLSLTPEDERPELCSSRAGRLASLPGYGFLTRNSALVSWARTQLFATRDNTVEAPSQAAIAEPPDDADENTTDETETISLPQDDPSFALTRALLNEIHRIGAANDIPVLILIIPQKEDPSAAATAVWREMCRVDTLTCVSVDALGPDEYFQNDGHWTADGHRVAGAALFNAYRPIK